MINKQYLWVLALGIALLTACGSVPQTETVQPSVTPSEPNYKIPPFAKITYEVCQKGVGCETNFSTHFTPVKDIALKEVKLSSSLPPKSMIFIKSRGCAGTYFTPQKEDYYATDGLVSGSIDQYTIKIIKQEKVPLKHRSFRIQQAKDYQELIANLGNPWFKTQPCKSFTRLNTSDK